MSDKTRIDVTLGVRIAGVDCPLTASVISGEKAGWAFSGSAERLGSLRDMINRLYAQMTGESREVFDSRIFPPVDFTALSFEFGGEPARFVVRSTFENLGIVKSLAFTFARLEGPGGSGDPRYLVGICTDASLNLVDIAGTGGGELIKQLLGNVSLDRVGLYYASDQIDDVAFFRGSSERQRFAKGPSLSARFGTATSHVDLALSPPKQNSSEAGWAIPLPSPALQPEVNAPATAAVRPPGEPAEPKQPVAKLPDAPFRYWKDIEKTFGPLQLRRIGGEWDGKNGTIGILLDSSIELAGLKVGLAGLCVKVPPSKLTSLKFADLQFGLDGLELSFQRGPVSISGALLRTRDGNQVGYAGMASIRAASFAIGAIGAYTSIENKPSFFIFGAYSGILGGPPFFIVTGVAAGFGYNRAIVLPDLDELRAFPLVSLVLGPSPGSTSGKSMLDQLGTSTKFPATAGQHWFAAGVKFSSFKLIDAFALVTVQFGTRFEIALLGVATLQQPPGPRPFLFVELALKVRFAPDDGLLSLTAALTASSYLFDTRCKLTGGLALCIWFNPTDLRIPNKHAGDFVLSIGGYHPKFKIPPHYPRVPRVGFDWQLPGGVVIKGEAYFALTTSCIMVGGRLSVVFQAGPIRVWFEAYADVLIGWAPFHYEIAVGVRVGVAFVMSFGDISTALSFELGAALQLWGPPFAGEVYVSLGFISFTVPIGDRSASRTAPALTWPQFAETFLPPDDRTPPQTPKQHRPLRVSIIAGIVSEHKSADTRVGRYVIVNSSDLLVSVESLVPVTTLLPNALLSVTWTKKLGIRPMGRTSLDAKLELSCTREASDGSAPVPQPMIPKPILKNLPEALWGTTPVPDARLQNEISSSVIENCLSGVQLMPADDHKPAEHRVSRDVHPITLTVKKPTKPDASPAPWDDSDRTGDGPFGRLRTVLGSPTLPAAQDGVLAALRACGFDLPQDPIHLSGPDGAPELADALLVAPWLVKIGELLPVPAGA